jgi:hypothetical protein
MSQNELIDMPDNDYKKNDNLMQTYFIIELLQFC